MNNAFTVLMIKKMQREETRNGEKRADNIK